VWQDYLRSLQANGRRRSLLIARVSLKRSGVPQAKPTYIMVLLYLGSFFGNQNVPLPNQPTYYFDIHADLGEAITMLVLSSTGPRCDFVASKSKNRSLTAKTPSQQTCNCEVNQWGFSMKIKGDCGIRMNSLRVVLAAGVMMLTLKSASAISYDVSGSNLMPLSE